MHLSIIINNNKITKYIHIYITLLNNYLLEITINKYMYINNINRISFKKYRKKFISKNIKLINNK